MLPETIEEIILNYVQVSKQGLCPQKECFGVEIEKEYFIIERNAWYDTAMAALLQVVRWIPVIWMNEIQS